jgi:hypothetical protein
MGMRALGRGDTGAAMAWALKSQDAKFTTYLADRLLAEYATTGLTTMFCNLVAFRQVFMRNRALFSIFMRILATNYHVKSRRKIRQRIYIEVCINIKGLIGFV